MHSAHSSLILRIERGRVLSCLALPHIEITGLEPPGVLDVDASYNREHPQRLTDDTDRQIDLMGCERYELTEEEIAIVEGG